MTTAHFRLIALRALAVDGGRLVRGAEFRADAGHAGELLRLGAARLADDADLPRLFAALNLHNGSRWAAPHTR